MSTSARDGVHRAGGVRTFLIADIRGYTRYTAQHGDEAASHLTQAFAGIVAEGVEAWNGELVELRGDEALAVFDSGRQALRCAIELQDAFAHETAAAPDVPLPVGMGLEAGEAVPVDKGYRGAALNLAARLCSAAAGGEVIASANLVHLVGPVPGLAFRPMPAKEFKGIEGAVDAVMVSDADPSPHDPGAGPHASAAVPAFPPELEPMVPLVGRAPDLRWLAWHWRRAREGHGRTVVLSGPPGIGKTRLAAELAVTVHAEGAPVRYLPSAHGADAEDLLADGRGAPMLLLVDDLDAASSPLTRVVGEIARRTADTNCLLVVTHRQEASAVLLAAVEKLATAERRRTLMPLEPDAVRAIAAIYAGRAMDELPLRELVEESGGVPAAIHRVAARWARTTATRRLGSSVDLTEAGRRNLRSAEDALMGDVADLEVLRERSSRLERELSSDGQPSVTICPYKGLAAYDAVDADYYFGRERLVAELVARLVGNHFLGLVGASGSGKSSVLRAGLLPALAGGVLPGSDRWMQLIIRPGEHPLAELAHGLARARPDEAATPADAEQALTNFLSRLAPGQELLLAVDQFEEVFDATRDETERSTFIDLLAKERPGLRVLVTLRADHYGHCAAYPALARLIGTSHVLVGPLTPAELETVIEAPAQRVGLRVEAGLVKELVTDAGTEPGVLPLLSTSLLELWQARQSGQLTLAAYHAGGGLRGSVARLAEAAYAELNPGQAAIARSVFLRLAGPGEGEGVVRRRVSLAELDVDRDRAVAQVLDTLTGARLLTTGDGFVEVAHEALLREWPRLQAWLEEDAAGRRVRLHLIGAVRDWEQRRREPADLYRGARLSAALDWAAEHEIEVNTAERQFLDESRQASEREVERERRRNRRLRALLAAAAVLLVVAVGAGAVALTQANAARDQAAVARQREADAVAARGQAETSRSEAEKARTDAETAALFARSRELAASSVSMLGKDPSLAKLLALSAADLVPNDVDAQIASALHQAWSADAVVSRYAWPKDKPISELWTDISPDGGLIVATGGYGYPRHDLQVADRATDRVLWAYSPEWAPASVGPAYFTADGSEVIAGVFWEPNDDQKGQQPPPGALGVHIWDARTGRLVHRFDTGVCGSVVIGISTVAALAMSLPAGPDAAPGCWTEGPETLLETVALDSGARKTLVKHGIGDGALSRDGRFAAFSDADDDFKAIVLDLATGKRVLRLDPSTLGQQNRFVRDLSPDGSLLLYGDRPVKVIEVDTGAVVTTLPQSSGELYNAEFAPSGTTLYTSGRDATMRAWDASTGDLLFTSPTAGSGHASATRDGRVLVTDRTRQTATFIDPHIRGELATIPTCAGFVAGGSTDAVGDTATFLNQCDGEPTGRSFVLDLSSRQIVSKVLGAWGQSLALSADGTRILRQEGIATGYGPLRIYDARTGAALVELQGLCTWESRDDAGCKPFPQTPFALAEFSLAWSPDGKMVAAIDDDTGVMVAWDAISGRLLTAQEGPSPSLFWDITFTPNSDALVVSAGDGELVEFSTDTWEISRRSKIDPSIFAGSLVGFAGFLPDAQTLVGVGGFQGQGGGSLLLIDLATLTVRESHPASDGSPKSMAVSPDGRLAVIGASDGLVRVWDIATGTVLDEFQVKGQAQGVAFSGNDRVIIIPQDGTVLVMTLDPGALVNATRASLTRGFTADECARFNFGDQCPSLEQLRGSP